MSSRTLGAVTATVVALLASTSASALKINLIDQGGVTGSQAQQGFKIAAAYWESVITNNVTLNFGVSYAALGAGIIGETDVFAMDYTVKNWETGVNATKSGYALDQTAVLPGLSGGNASDSGAVQMITSGYQVTSPTNACPSGKCGVDTDTRVWDTDTNNITGVNNKILYLSKSNVKAVGGTVTYDVTNIMELDAEIQFSSTFGFDFDPSDGTSANTFDFIGTAIHEMGHALGFVSGLDDYDYFGLPNGPCKTTCGNGFPSPNVNFNSTSLFTALDMFRYSTDPTNVAPGTGPVLDLSVGTAAYFSIDGGANQLFGGSLFATGAYNGDGDQASHWKDNNGADGCSVQLGIMDPTDCYGQEDYVTALDLAAFDAIGWNLNFDVLADPRYHKTTKAFYAEYLAANGPVPEPANWALMLAGFGLIGGALRRRSAMVRLAR